MRQRFQTQDVDRAVSVEDDQVAAVVGVLNGADSCVDVAVCDSGQPVCVPVVKIDKPDRSYAVSANRERSTAGMEIQRDNTSKAYRVTCVATQDSRLS